MEDRELLELAAKASGIEIGDWSDSAEAYLERCGQWWNPLIDDGDALRLAVKLGIDTVVSVERPPKSSACPPGGDILDYIDVDHNGDPYAATRRAIVLAAVEMGRAM